MPAWALPALAATVLVLAAVVALLVRRLKAERAQLAASRHSSQVAAREAHNAWTEAAAARAESAAARTAADHARAETERARAESQAIRRLRDDVTLVTRLAQEIADPTLAPAMVAGRIASLLHETWRAGCAVRVLTAEGRTLISLAAEGRPLPPDAPSHAGLAGYALHRRQLVSFTGEPPAALPLTPEEKQAYARARSVWVLPLPRGHDRVLGVLELACSEEAAAARDESVLQALAVVAAGGLETARRRQKIEREVAERRAHEDELAAAQSGLQEELKQRDEFLATMAHELRTPLNAIIGWGQVLRSGIGDEMTHGRAIEAMVRNAGQQSRLISDLLDLSRVRSGTLRLELQPVELTAVVRSALDTVRPAAETKRVRLHSVVDAEAGPLHADLHRLQQVLCNLLVNAVKFTPADSEVQVTAERDGEEVELRVRDGGSGIADEFMPHLFEAFRQGPGRPARVHGSLGLGLAIVRQLVEAHGGRVQARNNTPDPGATFVIRLPLRPPVTAAGPPPDDQMVDARELPSLDGLRVVVADEDMEGLDLVCAVLRDQGAAVSPAASTAEALEAVKQTRPDLLIANLEMEGDLIQQVRSLPVGGGGMTPAVALTGQGTTAERIRALLAGYQGQIGKPVRPAEMVALVATLTDRVRTPALTS